MPTDIRQFNSTFPGAAALFSLVALTPSYEDNLPVARIRRSSDNVESDFTANQIIDGTLTSFCGIDHGFLVGLYDQSGNNRHAGQANKTLQRRVVIAGELQTSYGKPVWVGVDSEYESFSFDASSSNATLFVVGQPDVDENHWTPFAGATSSNVLHVAQGVTTRDGKGTSVGASVQIYNNGSLQSITSRADAYNSFPGGDEFIASITNINVSGSSWNFFKYLFGDPFTATLGYKGKISFLAFYNSDVSSNRAAIEQMLTDAFRTNSSNVYTNTIYDALTANGSSESYGIKNLNVFYDTLHINLKTEDKTEYILLDKIDFDYNDNDVESDQNSIILNFGNTGSSIPNNTNGNCFIDTILHEKDKILFVCGLSSGNTVSQLQNGIVHTAKAMTPVIFLYDINEHSSRKVYPIDDAWTTQPFGSIFNVEKTSVSYNPNTNKLNYFLRCERSLSSVSATSSVYFWVDVDLQFTQSEFILTDVKFLSSGKINDVDIVANKSFNNQEKLLITNTGDDILIYSH